MLRTLPWRPGIDKPRLALPVPNTTTPGPEEEQGAGFVEEGTQSAA